VYVHPRILAAQFLFSDTHIVGDVGEAKFQAVTDAPFAIQPHQGKEHPQGVILHDPHVHPMNCHSVTAQVPPPLAGVVIV
jgi:hypothetical protein